MRRFLAFFCRRALVELFTRNPSMSRVADLFDNSQYAILTRKFGHLFSFLHSGVTWLGPRAPKLLVFRDSFTTRMIPFLSPEFSEVQYIWKNDELDRQRIILESPDIVIMQIIERTLPRMP